MKTFLTFVLGTPISLLATLLIAWGLNEAGMSLANLGAPIGFTILGLGALALPLGITLRRLLK